MLFTVCSVCWGCSDFCTGSTFFISSIDCTVPTLHPCRSFVRSKLPGWPRPSFQSLKFENVLDHGAVNDGTTDCTAAFAAAFAASQNVFIPSG